MSSPDDVTTAALQRFATYMEDRFENYQAEHSSPTEGEAIICQDSAAAVCIRLGVHKMLLSGNSTSMIWRYIHQCVQAEVGERRLAESDPSSLN